MIACALALVTTRASAQSTHVYVDRGVERTIVELDGGELLVRYGANGSFRARLGTDRVLVTIGSSARSAYVGALEAHSRTRPASSSTPAVESSLAQLDVIVDEVLSASAHVLAVRSTRGESAFELAERLAPLVRAGVLGSAMPDLALEHVASDIAIPPNDPRYGGQWFFDTIDIESAWSREDGDASVTVAVVDDGCDLAHPDLVPHLLPGYDAVDDDDDPSYLPSTEGNNHGTACAGLVAATTDNGIDVAGACPECSLRCVRLLGAPGALIPISADVRAFEFALAQTDVAVVSNSWGFVDGAPAPGPLVSVIERIQVDGRGGRGAVVVFAAGNDAATIGPDELQAIPGVVTVGAINNFDEATSFSNMGDSVAMVAPTGSLTTDISGPDGDDPGDVTSHFGGTSSACPIVAGVVGLLASADATLDAAALRAAIVETVRPAPFARPDAEGHDPLYGYGVVDPRAALDRVLPPLPDAGTDDDASTTLDAGADAATAPATASSCACRAGASGSGSGSGLALVIVVALALVRRRARRVSSLALAALLVACTSAPSEVRPTVQELRPDTPGSTEMPPRYDATDVVESLVSPGGSFRIHFTRAGRHAVPSADADGDGVPDYVSLVASTYDEVLAFDVAEGFRPPAPDGDVPVDNGGDALFDVYLVDFAGVSDGSFRREICSTEAGCTGYMLQENDFAGYHYPTTTYAVRLLASHELFHAVQAAYPGTQGTTLSESTAVWASERFDASLQDLEGFSDAYTSRTDRSLAIDPIGAAQSYTYGAAIVWEHLTTTFDDDLVHLVLEELEGSDENWLVGLDAVLAREHGTSFAEVFPDFAEWLVFTGSRSAPDRGPSRSDEIAEIATVDAPLPFHDDLVRMFPASIRYFEVPSSTVEVRVMGEGADEIDVLALAFTGTRFAIGTRGRGEASLRAPLAETAIVALVDARVDGESRVLSLCMASTEGECETATEDAGVGDGAILADAGAPDASVTPAPTSSCACTAGGHAGRPAWSGIAAMGLTAGLIRRRRSRRTISQSARLRRAVEVCRVHGVDASG